MSDQSLRDALESYFSNGGPDTPIRTTWHEGIEHWEAPASDIRELLAAHPAEPAPDRQPSDAAARAAGEMLWNLHSQTRGWDELNPGEQDQMISEGRAVVEAAYRVDAPRPALKPEQIAAVIHGSDHDSAGTRCPGSDSCQLWFDAERAEERVLALLNGAGS